MCLAVFALNVHPRWPLIVVANRDEFHARPTSTMQPWEQSPAVLAGRDLQASGTWLGLRSNGQFALLTNVRDPSRNRAAAPSRGHLVEHFLMQDTDPAHYLEMLSGVAADYNGFNLIVGDGNGLWHASNYQSPLSQRIAPGVHGLSNALLDSSWPKTDRSKLRLQQYLQQTQSPDPDDLVEILLDRQAAADSELPHTGISLARERLLSSPFIVSPDYGTRCTTVVLRHSSGLYWAQEDSYDPLGQRTSRLMWQQIEGGAWQLTQTGPQTLST